MRGRNTINTLSLMLLLLIVTLIISCRSIPLQNTEKVLPVLPSTIEEAVSPGETAELQNSEQEVDNLLPANFPQLTDSEIERILLNTIPGSFLPVTNDNGRIRIIFSDLDQNGYRDAFFLVVKNREGLDAGFSNLSDVSNLLKDNSREVDFFLAVYLQLKGSMISMYRIPIGSSDVLSDFSVFQLKKGDIIPLGINISFQALKGLNSEWIIFSTYNKFSLFSMTENISSHSITSDIDGNNVLDIVEWEDGLEEGTGYETYLTWYRWNGKEYREYLSTNIVRNLNAFLEQSGLYLAFDQKEEFFIYSLNSGDLLKYRNSSKKYSDWLSRIFRPVPGSNSESDNFEDCSKIQSIIFPSILENPYTPGNNTLNICNLNVRFVCTDGYSFIRTVRILMNPNPFQKQQFSFYLE